MKKTIFKVINIILCVVLLTSSVTQLAFAQDKKANSSAFSAEDMLKTKGKKIVNQKGDTVELRGVNLGGWLIQEEWMCPVNVSDTITTLEIFTERFGIDKAYELMNTYEENWITEYDLDIIKASGFNCVRVPFWYRNFYYDDAGTKIYDANGEWDFSRLDWVIETCSEKGLYVILDLHGAPGYQNNAEHSGKSDSCSLYKLNVQGEKYRKLTVELWTAIATRYADEPAVAMYDLLNEPTCNVSNYPDNSRIMTIAMYNRLYNAIRKVDSKHIITMEGIWRLFKLPYPKILNWKNVVYQLHMYQETNYEFKLLSFTANLYPFNVPIYIGEFKSLGSATWDVILSNYNNYNYSWTIWSYKGFSDGANNNDWFVYGSKDASSRVDIYKDSYDTILEKWGNPLRTENNYESTGLKDIVKDYIYD